MKKLLILGIILSSIFSFGQIGFEENIILSSITGVYNPSKAITIDIDNDGDLDIVASSERDNKISWYKNDGLGNFEQQRVITQIAHDVQDIFAADIDGDNDLDLISANGSLNNFDSITWYENIDGLGNFGNQQLIAITNGANSVYAGDIDNDGDIDVVSASSNFIEEVVWYENVNGEGLFEEKQIIANNAHFTDIELSDIDNDGDLDLITTSGWNQEPTVVAWYKNDDGLGNFGSKRTIVIQSWAYGFNNVFTTDIDNDGDQDIVTSFNSTQITSKIYWHENFGNNIFGTPQIISLDSKTNHIFPADIDNDGDIDIVSSSYINDTVSWHENIDGQGSFGDQNIITDIANGANSVCAGDIDGNNTIDIISSSTKDDKIAWYKNTLGDGNFGEQQIISHNFADAISSVFLADIDNDGFDDLITSSGGDDKIAWYKALDDQGNFGNQKILTVNADTASSVYVEDLDGDNDLDIVFGSRNDDKIGWFENLDGLGNFSEEQIISTDGAGIIFAKDIDLDGDIDLITTYFYTNKVVWFENLDGQATFSTANNITLPSNHKVNNIDVTDFNGDGKLDIVTAAFQTDTVGLLINNGNGGFNPLQIINTIDGVTNVFASDLDNDGDQDIISSSKWDDKLIWYKNDGLSNFNESMIIDINVKIGGSYSINTADIDNDGDLDIIANSSISNQMYWFENLDGIGNFDTRQIISSNDHSSTIVFPYDINNDGLIDLLSATAYTAKLLWYKNIGQVNRIDGIIKMDTNFNGCNTNDFNDIKLDNIMVIAESDTNTYATFTRNGYYQLNPNIGDYTVTASPYLPDYYSFNPASQNIIFNDIGNSENASFCLEPITTGISDLNIDIYPITDARPGFDASYIIAFNNVGLTMLDGDITFEFDETKLNFLTATESITSQTNNSITFNYNYLNLLESRFITLNFNVLPPPITNIDDVLSFTTTINPLIGDQTEEDNIANLEQIVIGSYDPNDITVLEGDEISITQKDDFLHYLIRFQNTGTASATNVKVTNLLDNKLDWTTLELVSLSHDNHVEIINGNEITFYFDNIYLPDEHSNNNNSHGYIAYKIKPKDNVAIGDFFTNKANIFFDFNPAIETNTVTTEIVPYIDTESPIAICQDITIELDNNGIVTLNAFNVDGGSTDNQSIISYTLDINNFSCNDLGENSVILTVTDSSDNSSSCNAIVTIVDNLSPTTNIPLPIIVECFDEMPSPDIQVITNISDNCTAKPTVIFVSDASNGNTNPEIITRTYSVTDNNGNTLLVEQLIEINDVTNPTASNLTSINVQCNDEIPVPDILLITDASDNCTNTPTITFTSDVSNGNICPEIITRTYSIFDDSNNVFFINQLITIIDTENPIANCNDITINLDASNNASITANDINNNSTDNCGIDSISVNPNTFTSENLGDNNVILTVTDLCGNTNTCNAIVTVNSTISIEDYRILKFDLYPNPTTGKINIESDTSIFKISFYSKLGQLILENKNQTEIDISNLSQGIYFVKVEDIDGNFGVKKVIKK